MIARPIINYYFKSPKNEITNLKILQPTVRKNLWNKMNNICLHISVKVASRINHKSVITNEQYLIDDRVYRSYQYANEHDQQLKAQNYECLRTSLVKNI